MAQREGRALALPLLSGDGDCLAVPKPNRDALAQGVLDLRHCIGMHHERADLPLRRVGNDADVVPDVRRRFADATEIPDHFDIDLIDVDPEIRGLPADIVAVAGREGEEQQFSTVHIAAALAVLRRYRQRAGATVRAHGHVVGIRPVKDPCANSHGDLRTCFGALWWLTIVSPARARSVTQGCPSRCPTLSPAGPHAPHARAARCRWTATGSSTSVRSGMSPRRH